MNHFQKLVKTPGFLRVGESLNPNFLDPGDAKPPPGFDDYLKCASSCPLPTGKEALKRSYKAM